MLHGGIALELSRLIVDDRKADAKARRRVRAAEASLGSRVGVSASSDRRSECAAPMLERRNGGPADASEDPWRAWRVVEPDAEYLRHPAA